MIWEQLFMKSILLHLFRWVLWPSMWPVLVNIPCELEKCVFCCCWMKQSLSVISIWLVLLSSAMFLLIFCLLDLSISDRGSLKFPAVIVDSSISPYSSKSFCLTYFDALLLGIYMVRTVMSSCRSDPFIIMHAYIYYTFLSLSLIIFLARESAFSELNMAIPAFFWLVLA